MGAIISHASENDLKSIYDFGVNLGIAFQLQDDTWILLERVFVG
jgi:geranylgeranyl diphosphate synthase type II